MKEIIYDKRWIVLYPCYLLCIEYIYPVWDTGGNITL